MSCGWGMRFTFTKKKHPLTKLACVCIRGHFNLFSICVYSGYRCQMLCHTLSFPPVLFCPTGKDKHEGGRFKSNTYTGRHGSVCSSIKLLHPPCATWELGCFHGDQVFDGQVCVWWLVRWESFYPLLSSKWDAKDLASTYEQNSRNTFTYSCMHLVHALWWLHWQLAVEIIQVHSQPTLGMSSLRYKSLHGFYLC